jgi:hypothetical protein
MSRRVIFRKRGWVHIPDLESLGDVAISPGRRIFAIVSGPIPTGVEGKTARHVLIFDNHPDSLRLALESGVDSDSDDAELRRARRTSIVCGSILIAMVVAAILWPLWW